MVGKCFDRGFDIVDYFKIWMVDLFDCSGLIVDMDDFWFVCVFYEEGWFFDSVVIDGDD